MIANVVAVAALMAGVAQAQVTATGTMGVTNPPAATMGTAVNQTSMSRLISLNSIDDFCLFAPPEPNSVIGNTEAYEVAWCMQQRNDARLIPEGTFTAVHFVKTPMYWQIQGLGDLTKINIAANDEGGELDPHGATGDGNPVGGNVTTNATGSDVSYEEWMNYMSYNMFCLRICINQMANVTAAEQCQHTLDEMGCNWVMPGDYTDNSFTECDADAAYPPGWYPQPGGSISTFAQRYTGTYTSPDGATALWTVGETVTPQTAYSTPASSNCITYSTINYAAATAGVSAPSGMSSGASGSGSGSSASATGSASSGSGVGASGSKATGGASKSASAGGSSASGSTSSGAAHAQYSGSSLGPMLAGFVSVVAVVAGALLV